ncbi:phosphate ABC transporter permease subunit PstC [Flavobacterium rhizosphaerae]|uniref:Phosphate transport system permease protein n=1 Tax=Flavobacterium rhizosphaerae TaxID=3163298 RepID=A0ABW8Z0Z6_9FLAO
MPGVRYIVEYIRKWWMLLTLLLIFILPFAIGASLIYKSWPIISGSVLGSALFGSEWMPIQGKFGLWPFIVNSVIITLTGLLLMTPVCLAAAIYITQFAPLWVRRLLRTVIDILAGIPSVIFGLWGIITIVPIISGWAVRAGAENATGYSVLAAGMVIAVATIPYVLNMLIELFEAVSMELMETGLAMGASKWQTIRDVIMIKIRHGIIASFTLGVSKAFGETIAVLMVVGNVIQIPKSVFDSGYPLPALLANNYGEMMSIPNYDAALMLSALVLLVIVILFNYIAHKVIGHYHLKSS